MAGKKGGKFETKYNFSDLYPGAGEGLSYEGGVAVNLASSITQVARLNNQLDMSPTLKARKKPLTKTELEETVFA